MWDAYSFLVNRRIFEFSDEGGGEGEGEGKGENGNGNGTRRGRGRGRGKVARRFEREMGWDRYVFFFSFLFFSFLLFLYLSSLHSPKT